MVPSPPQLHAHHYITGIYYICHPSPNLACLIQRHTTNTSQLSSVKPSFPSLSFFLPPFFPLSFSHSFNAYLLTGDFAKPGIETRHSNNTNSFLYGTYILVDVFVPMFGGGKDEKPKKITMEKNRNGICETVVSWRCTNDSVEGGGYLKYGHLE